MLTEKNNDRPDLEEVKMAERPMPKLLMSMASIHDTNARNKRSIEKLNEMYYRISGNYAPEVSEVPDLKSPQSENLNEVSDLVAEEAQINSELLSILIKRLEEYV